MSLPARPDSSRRHFLKTATVASAGLAAGPGLRPILAQNRAPAPGRVLGANDRLVVAVIGLQRGLAHIRGHLGVKNVEVAYVCDVDSDRLAAGCALAQSLPGGETAMGVSDFRRILDDPRVDAISIATPNFWHAVGTILGCQAGKHVYVEKPGSHTAAEAEAMVVAAQTYRRQVQMGNQRRSYPRVIEAMERLRAGAIGRVLYSRTWYKASRGTIGRGRPAPVPSRLDYTLWQGPCPERPYQDNLVHYNWHWVWNYGGGELANNGIHYLDIARWGLGVDYPRKVAFVGGRYHFDDDQETPDTGTVTYDFGASGASWDFSSCNARKGEQTPAIAFYGDRGSMLLSGANDYTVCDPDGKVVEKQDDGRGSDLPHFQNFADAIRLGRPLTSPIAEGQKSTMLCHLGNLAYRLGQTIEVDPRTGQVRGGHAGARALWSREYRPGWGIQV